MGHRSDGVCSSLACPGRSVWVRVLVCVCLCVNVCVYAKEWKRAWHHKHFSLPLANMFAVGPSVFHFVICLNQKYLKCCKNLSRHIFSLMTLHLVKLYSLLRVDHCIAKLLLIAMYSLSHRLCHSVVKREQLEWQRGSCQSLQEEQCIHVGHHGPYILCGKREMKINKHQRDLL